MGAIAFALNIQTIALLCQISSTGSLQFTEEMQIICHKYYAECLEKKNELLPCIKERK